MEEQTIRSDGHFVFAMQTHWIFVTKYRGNGYVEQQKKTAAAALTLCTHCAMAAALPLSRFGLRNWTGIYGAEDNWRFARAILRLFLLF